METDRIGWDEMGSDRIKSKVSKEKLIEEEEAVAVIVNLMIDLLHDQQQQQQQQQWAATLHTRQHVILHVSLALFVGRSFNSRQLVSRLSPPNSKLTLGSLTSILALR